MAKKRGLFKSDSPPLLAIDYQVFTLVVPILFLTVGFGPPF